MALLCAMAMSGGQRDLAQAGVPALTFPPLIHSQWVGSRLGVCRAGARPEDPMSWGTPQLLHSSYWQAANNSPQPWMSFLRE